MIVTVINLLVEMKIEEFMEFYRKELPQASVTPKLHILEDHVVHWTTKWQFGLGFGSGKKNRPTGYIDR